MRKITVLLFVRFLASVSQLLRWLYVALLQDRVREVFLYLFFFFSPLCEKILVPCDIVHHHSPSRPAVIASSDSPKQEPGRKRLHGGFRRDQKEEKNYCTWSALDQQCPKSGAWSSVHWPQWSWCRTRLQLCEGNPPWLQKRKEKRRKFFFQRVMRF